jgi:hypothetical protein
VICHAGFRLNRHPINIDQSGNLSQSYVKSSSIHLSYNRAISIQGSHALTVENTVIYNTMGCAVSLEDGIETGHVFRANLIVTVRAKSNLLREDFTPAAFLVSLLAGRVSFT